MGEEAQKGKAMNNCPHCGAEDNNGGTFLCGTRYVGYVGTDTFRSQQCRDRVTYKKRSKDKAMNHIGDGNKMVSETPRTDAVIEICRDGSNEMHGEWVSSDFARQLERELDRCNKMYRKLDVHSLNLSDLIRKLECELQQWKEYAGRLEEAGNRMYVLLDPASICMRTTGMDNALQGWDDAKISTTQTK